MLLLDLPREVRRHIYAQYAKDIKGQLSRRSIMTSLPPLDQSDPPYRESNGWQFRFWMGGDFADYANLLRVCSCIRLELLPLIASTCELDINVAGLWGSLPSVALALLPPGYADRVRKLSFNTAFMDANAIVHHFPALQKITYRHNPIFRLMGVLGPNKWTRQDLERQDLKDTIQKEMKSFFRGARHELNRPVAGRQVKLSIEKRFGIYTAQAKHPEAQMLCAVAITAEAVETKDGDCEVQMKLTKRVKEILAIPVDEVGYWEAY